MKHTSLYRLMESLNKSRCRSTWVGVTTFGDRFTKRLCDGNINSYIMCTKLLIVNYTWHTGLQVQITWKKMMFLPHSRMSHLGSLLSRSDPHISTFPCLDTIIHGIEVYKFKLQCRHCVGESNSWSRGHLTGSSLKIHIMWLLCHVTAVSCDCGVMWLRCQTAVSCDCGVMWLLYHVTAVSCDCGVMWLRCHVTAVSCDCCIMWLLYHMTSITSCCSWTRSTSSDRTWFFFPSNYNERFIPSFYYQVRKQNNGCASTPTLATCEVAHPLQDRCSGVPRPPWSGASVRNYADYAVRTTSRPTISWYRSVVCPSP